MCEKKLGEPLFTTTSVPDEVQKVKQPQVMPDEEKAAPAVPSVTPLTPPLHAPVPSVAPTE